MIVQVALPLPLKDLYTYRIPDAWAANARRGQTVLVPFRNRTMRGVIMEIGPAAPPAPGKKAFQIKEVIQIISDAPALSDNELELARWISDQYGASLGESLKTIGNQPRKAKRAPKVLLNVSPYSIAGVSASGAQPASLTLTKEQAAGLEPIREAIRKKSFATFLLHGVTASGKTEIYLRAIQEALDQKRQALFLVPEISLCPPFHDILQQRFGERVGVWHSQAAGKSGVAEKVKKGEIDIILGARSALFVPLRNLGVIVLDEEHDPSYKQDEKPRYHAREVALKLAEMNRAAVILGSATPSVESYYRAQQGDYKLLELRERAMPTGPLAVTLVDQKIHSKKSSPFSEVLINALEQILQKRQQAILAINRRGYSTFLFCGDCKKVWKCPNCQVTLVSHRDYKENGHGHYIKCHYCFYKKRLPGLCDNCGSNALMLGGQGTQRVAQEIQKIFPFARVLRLDRDVARKKSAAQETYQAFKDESADILVGTQMVVQGFDFPRVTLVGIVDADTALFHPDFRAAERTFEWVIQAAGRAGRGTISGTVIVQSSMPDHYALQCGVQQNYRAFYDQEIEFRRSLNYPPFTRLLLFEISSANRQDLVADESDRLVSHLKAALLEAGDEKTQLLGPGPASHEHLRKRLRWQVLAKCAGQKEVEVLIKASDGFTPKSSLRMTVDVDPYDLS